MMDQIASLMARGLISPDAAQGLVQQVNDIRNKPTIGNFPLEGGGGRGVGGGASGKPVIAPDYGADVSPKKLTRKQRMAKEARDAMMQESRERMTHLGAPNLDELKDKE